MPVHIIVKDTRTMDMTVDQQVALDKALVPHASRLRIGKSNFRLRSDITSKESTLQLVSSSLNTFQDGNKKRIVNLEYFKEMLHICPRLPGQTFDELPFEEEILAFLRFLRHNREIRKLTDVNINKLHQPWRSFAAIINKCLSGKSTSYNSLRLSQAHILWRIYHKKNVDFSYLLWEDFVYQVEHKDAKKSNEMYYPRFTKVIIHYFMTKDPSIPRRNEVNWHYVRDDQMFKTIKLVSIHQNTQQFSVMLPVELTNEDIRNFKAYKEYYAVVSGAAPPKTKASVKKTKSSSDTTITPPTAAGTRLSTSAKGKQPAKASKAKGLTVLSEVAMIEAEQMNLAMKRSLQQTHIYQASASGADEGTSIIPGVPDVLTDESDEEISWKSSDEDDDDEVDERSDDQEDDDDQDDDDQNDNDDDQDTDNDDDDFVHPKLSIHEEEKAKDEERFDPIVQTPENYDDEGNDDASLGLNVGGKEGQDAEDDDKELYRDVNINLEGQDVQMTDVHTAQEFKDTHVTLTLVNHDGIDSLFATTPRVDVQASTIVAPLTLTSPFLPPQTIPTISEVPQAPTPPTTSPSTFLKDLPNFISLFRFNHRLKTLEANFSEFVQTNQFAGAVSSIPEIVEIYMDQWMNEAVKVAVQIQFDKLRDEAQAQNEAFLNNLDENIQKIIKEQVKEQVKQQDIQRSDEKRNLYKALVDAYESDKIILDTYRDTVTLKRHRDDADKDAEPFARSDRGSKRRREGKETESISALKEKATKTTSKSTQGSRSHQKTASESAPVEEPMQTTQDLEDPSHQEFETDTLTHELLAGPTYEVMKGSYKSIVELEFFLEEVYKATTDKLDWNNPEGQQYLHNLLKPLPLILNSRGRHVIPFDNFINNDLEYLRGGASSRKKSARYVYSKRRIIAVTELQIVEWHNYKHLYWITVCRDDDKLYKFKEGNFKRLRIQDIKDMLQLLVQGKLTNLTVEERFAFNTSLRMFTRSIVIQRRVQDL
nr:hypothetical protein [Tanacetum cinerariifolium]